MKITAIRTHPVTMPLDTSFWVANERISAASLIVFEVETDQGLTGLATVHGRSMPQVCRWAQALLSLLRGQDARQHEQIWHSIFALTLAPPSRHPDGPLRDSFLSHERAPLLAALAGIDIALWDLKGKAAGLPVWRLLGAARNEVPAYVTGGYYEEAATPDTVADEMAAYARQGFNAVKLKAGAMSLEQDEARIAAVRQAVGRGVDIMVDVNCAFPFDEAVRFAAMLQRHEVFWLEEPLSWFEPVARLRELADRTPVKLAMGESELHSAACCALADTGAIRYMQFDATRAGGVTEWLRLAEHCETRQVLMSTHHDPHIHGHLAAAAPNGFNVETFPNPRRDPLWDCLYTERAVLKDGKVVLNALPGFGFDIDWKVVDRYRAF